VFFRPGVRTLRLAASHGKRAIHTNHERKGENEKEQAALVFARKVVQDRGIVAGADVDMLRSAGYTKGEIGEIVANVTLNLFTNYFNHVAATGLDFLAAPDLAA
jgi:alkylhydroperoxidase family enzyme